MHLLSQVKEIFKLEGDSFDNRKEEIMSEFFLATTSGAIEQYLISSNVGIVTKRNKELSTIINTLSSFLPRKSLLNKDSGHHLKMLKFKLNMPTVKHCLFEERNEEVFTESLRKSLTSKIRHFSRGSDFEFELFFTDKGISYLHEFYQKNKPINNSVKHNIYGKDYILTMNNMTLEEVAMYLVTVLYTSYCEINKEFNDETKSLLQSKVKSFYNEEMVRSFEKGDLGIFTGLNLSEYNSINVEGFPLKELKHSYSAIYYLLYKELEGGNIEECLHLSKIISSFKDNIINSLRPQTKQPINILKG